MGRNKVVEVFALPVFGACQGIRKMLDESKEKFFMRRIAEIVIF